MSTTTHREIIVMMADVGALNRSQFNRIMTKLNERDAEEARRNMELDNDPDIWGTGGQG